MSAPRTYSYTQTGDATKIGGTKISTSNTFTTSRTRRTRCLSKGTGTYTGIETASNRVTPIITYDTEAEEAEGKGIKQPEVATALKELKETCLYLKKYAHYKKTDPNLPDAAYKKLMDVAELARRTMGTPEYAKFHKITTEIFGAVPTPERGTVGDFFVGCLDKDGCSVECAGNLPKPNFTKDNFCSTHVGHYKDGTMELHYSPAVTSDVILMHVDGKSELVLTVEDEDMLTNNGIKRVIISRLKDGSYQRVTDPIEVSNFVKEKENKDKNKVLGAKVPVLKKETASGGTATKTATSGSTTAKTTPTTKTPTTKTPTTKTPTIAAKAIVQKNYKESNLGGGYSDKRKDDCCDDRGGEGDGWGIIWVFIIILFIIIIIFIGYCCFAGYGNDCNVDDKVQDCGPSVRSDCDGDRTIRRKVIC